MPSQADIDHQQSLLRTYRRNLAHLAKQAASFGGEEAAPIHIANSLDDARANISRIKGILRGWGVTLEDGADEGAPATATTAQQSNSPTNPQTPATIPQLKSTTGPSFKYDVFISYSHIDEDWVEHTLLKALEEAGLRACIDFRDFAIGRPAIINMQDAVMESRHTILVVTEAWIKSEWTLFESLLTRTKDPSGLAQRTIPLRLQQVELPDFISMLTWVDFTRPDRHELNWRRLFEVLTDTASAVKKPSKIESAATPSDQLPLPPQPIAGQAMPLPTESSTSSTAGPSSLRDMKMQALNKRLANLMAEYEAVNRQIDGALSEVDRMRLKRQAENLEQEIDQIEGDLRAL